MPTLPIPSQPRIQPVTQVLIIEAALASEPPLNLSIGGHPGLAPPNSTRSAVKPSTGLAAASLAVSLATDAARFAIQTSNPQPTSVSRQHPGPLTLAITTTITASELQSLPIEGRRWQEFVLDSSSAAAENSPNTSPGASRQPTETSIDGTSTRTAFGGQGGSGPESSGPGSNGQGGRNQNGMGQAWAGGRGLQVAQMAIREVETAAGDIQSEESRVAGAHVNIQTQRGQNGLHGQSFFSDRQNTWGAQNPFTQWVKQTAPATLTTPSDFHPRALYASRPPIHLGPGAWQSDSARQALLVRRARYLSPQRSRPRHRQTPR